MCPQKDGKLCSLGPDGSILSDIVTLCHVTVTRRFVTDALSVMRPHCHAHKCHGVSIEFSQPLFPQLSD